MPSIELSDGEWGQVMQLISEGPWRVANPLLMKIGDQLRVQHQPIINRPVKGDGVDMEEGHEQPH